LISLIAVHVTLIVGAFYLPREKKQRKKQRKKRKEQRLLNTSLSLLSSMKFEHSFSLISY
jgi:Flp pilus assembly protein TadB